MSFKIIRICDECGKVMKEGYSIYYGDKHYCSRKCLLKHYTEKKWMELRKEPYKNYYAKWED